MQRGLAAQIVHHARIGVTLAAVLGAAPSCASGENAAGLGTAGASADAQPGLLVPLQPGDLEAIAARGRILYDMERALMLGYERGLFKVGDPGTDMVLPLVDVDPGGGSGQVVFVRWMDEDVPDAANLDPTKAQRWLLVSLVLWPDKVLDLEQVHDYVVEGGSEHERIVALLACAKRAAKLAPDQMFHIHTLREQTEVDKRTRRREYQYRVYLFAADRGGPDLEMTATVSKKHVAEVTAVKTVHEAGDVGDRLIHVRQAEPSPMTVMRAMQLGHTSGLVSVDTEGETTWTVATEDGRVSRE